MKKTKGFKLLLIAITAFVALLATLLAIPAQANKAFAENAKITVIGNTNVATTDNSVTFKLSYQNVPEGICSLNFYLNYDTSIFEIDTVNSVAATNIPLEQSLCNLTYGDKDGVSNGTVSINYTISMQQIFAGIKNVTDPSFDLYTLIFKIKSGVTATSSTITFDKLSALHREGNKNVSVPCDYQDITVNFSAQ